VTVPERWAALDSAFVRPWSDARTFIETRYNQLPPHPSAQLKKVLDLADELGTTDVIVEAPYIDHDYRSEYSQHFARRFRPPPDSNERLIFLDANAKAVGYSVIRPTTKPVGRTVMNVPARFERYVSCRARQTILAYGHDYEVEGFPFMSQDGEYGRCAHAAIWSIARLQHGCHETGRQSIASIVAATGTGHPPDRTGMSNGLTVEEARRALRMLGLPVLS
jgi:hypothetical protein